MVLILPFKGAEEDISVLIEALPFHVQTLSVRKDIDEMYDKKRGQYCSSGYVELCEDIGNRDDNIVLGVTAADLFSPRLNFVFGTARVGGWGCVISTHRLGPSSGLLFEERIVKEAVHEIGHTIGLNHCSDPKCVMHFSNSLADTDRKSDWFCDLCQDRFEKLAQERGLADD